MKKTFIAMFGIVLLSSNAFAGGTTGFGVGAKVGTLGLGIEAVKPISNNLDLRLGVNQFDYDANETLDGVDYTATLNMQTVSALADFRPMNNGFFVSGGVMQNGNELNATATVTTAEPVTIGTNTLTSGVVTSGVSFDDVSPYVGIGYRQSASVKPGWTFTADAGVLLQGDPKITLTESTNTVSQADIDAEIANVRDDVDALKTLPVVAIGAVYNF
jgi:hypothetical protein